MLTLARNANDDKVRRGQLQYDVILQFETTTTEPGPTQVDMTAQYSNILLTLHPCDSPPHAATI